MLCCIALAGYLEDAVKDTRKSVEDLFVAEAEDTVAKSSQPFGARLVIVLALIMAAAIKLNHQPVFNTYKVKDEYPHRMLATKVQSVKLPPAQPLPQRLLSWGGVPAHEPRRPLRGRCRSPDAAGLTVPHATPTCHNNAR
jgi:hypothetical protein